MGEGEVSAELFVGEDGGGVGDGLSVFALGFEGVVSVCVAVEVEIDEVVVFLF